jgi:hypothetical protein
MCGKAPLFRLGVPSSVRLRRRSDFINKHSGVAAENLIVFRKSEAFPHIEQQSCSSEKFSNQSIKRTTSAHKAAPSFVGGLNLPENIDKRFFPKPLAKASGNLFSTPTFTRRADSGGY